MSITDNATGGVNEPEEFNKSESQENSQGGEAQDASQVNNQDTGAANNPEDTGAEDTSATDNSQGFAHLGLPDDVQAAVSKVGFTQPSPIQAETIPILMEGRDRGPP